MESDGPSALLEQYFRALERGEGLAGFYVTDEEAGERGPVVKIGSGRGEVFLGQAQVTAAVSEVTRALGRNRLAARGPRMARTEGDVAWLFDQVWWSGEANGKAFGSLTRWTAVCLRTDGRGWRFLQVHVSEEVD